MIDKLLASVFALLMMVVISMQLLLWSLPLFKRLEFDAICHRYTQIMDQQGGMSAELKSRLASELASRDFTLAKVSATDHAAYGQPLNLYIQADFASSRFDSVFDLKEVIISVEYQSSTVCRWLKDFGVAR